MTLPSERVDNLQEMSDQVYDAGDTIMYGETVARRIVRLGILTVSTVLENSYNTGLAGDRYHALLVRELESTGFAYREVAQEKYPSYEKSTDNLPEQFKPVGIDMELLKLANDYADIKRRTFAKSGQRETDASHVVHLSALALPYAAEHYPHLDQSKIALYCLIHDILEAYAGDVASLGASKEVMEQKQRDENEALETLISNFGQKYPKLIRCVQDYEHLVDDEARYVKTFDKLDPGFTHLYSDGKALTGYLKISSRDEFEAKVQETTDRMLPYCGDYLDLMDDRNELTQRIAEHTPWPLQS